MRRRVLLRLVIFLIVALGVVFAAYAVRQYTLTLAQTKSRAENLETHRRLYHRFANGLRITADMPALYLPLPTQPPVPSDASEFLKDIACRSDAVVVGTVTDQASAVTIEQTMVFTDYYLTVDSILRDATNGLVEGGVVTVSRPGGSAWLDGHVVAAKLEAYRPLDRNGTYLLFLAHEPTTGDFETRISAGAFRLAGPRLIPMSREELPSGLAARPADAVLATLRTALAAGCDR